MKIIFEVNDRIFNFSAGWGVVARVLNNTELYNFQIDYDNGLVQRITEDGKSHPKDKDPCVFSSLKACRDYMAK